jgi:hypothetical protein
MKERYDFELKRRDQLTSELPVPFQKTRIRDFEKLIVFLNQLHDVLWNMHHNGSRPKLRPMPHSVRSLVARKLKDLRENPNHEHIVAETRMCMSLITHQS